MECRRTTVGRAVPWLVEVAAKPHDLFGRRRWMSGEAFSTRTTTGVCLDRPDVADVQGWPEYLVRTSDSARLIRDCSSQRRRRRPLRLGPLHR